MNENASSKHVKRKCRFLHVENTQIENEGFYTYKTPKTKMRDSTRIKHTKRKCVSLHENKPKCFFKKFKKISVPNVVSPLLCAQFQLFESGDENIQTITFPHIILQLDRNDNYG